MSQDFMHASGHPVATIKAVHAEPNASKASSEDAGGLESIICLAHNARVMLTLSGHAAPTAWQSELPI